MDPQQQFIQSTQPQQRFDIPYLSPQDAFIQSTQPEQTQADTILTHQEPITDLLKRYELMWGEMSNPSEPKVDINFPGDTHHLYKKVFGHHRKPPEDLHQAVGEIKEALRGALTEKEMREHGEHISSVM